MLKVRYSKIRLPMPLEAFALRCARWRSPDPALKLRVLRSNSSEVILTHDAVRFLTVTDIGDNGEPVRRQVPTFEQHTFRIFQTGKSTILSVLNPGRGSRAVEGLVEDVMQDERYSIEALEISTELIGRHIRRFAAAKLVSAKVRDFKVYDTAVGRLEISSKTGLPAEIAPFLEGKFYRIDGLTYEITHDMIRGLIWYSAGGTVKMSGPVAETAFPLFEKEL
jgi:hypothetical protein